MTSDPAQLPKALADFAAAGAHLAGRSEAHDWVLAKLRDGSMFQKERVLLLRSNRHLYASAAEMSRLLWQYWQGDWGHDRDKPEPRDPANATWHQWLQMGGWPLSPRRMSEVTSNGGNDRRDFSRDAEL
jgi:hypothetical protein